MHMCVCVGGCETEREGVRNDADGARHRARWEEQACYGFLLAEIGPCIYFCEPAGLYLHNAFTDSILLRQSRQHRKNDAVLFYYFYLYFRALTRKKQMSLSLLG